MKIQNKLKLILPILGAVFIIVLPLMNRPSYVSLFIAIAFYSIGALGFRLLMIMGRFSLGQSFFVAAGGYTSAILSVRIGMDPWLGLILAVIVGMVFAFVIGLIILRVPGMYFAIITMALTMLAIQLISLFPGLTGGVAGLGKIPAYTIGGYSFGIELNPYYYLIMIMLAIVFLIMYRLERSPLGMINLAIGQNDELTEHMGMNIARQRLLIFTLTGGLTAMSGAFWVHYLHFISPAQVGISLALYYQIYAIVGGIYSPWGPLLGVVVLELVSHWLRIASYAQPIFYGALLVTVFIFIPRGLLSLPDRLRALRKVRPQTAALNIKE